MPKLAALRGMQAQRQRQRQAQLARHLLGTDPIANSQPIDEEQATAIVNRIRTAYEALKNGTDDPKRFDTLAWAMNVAAVRAADIDQRLLEVLVATTEALNATRARFTQTGRFGFTGPQIQTMNEALDAYEAILRASSPRQMHDADDTVERMMNGNWRRADATR